MTGEHEIRSVLARLVMAWNDADRESFVSCFAEDVEMDSPVGFGVFRGRDDVALRFDEGHPATGHMTIEHEYLVVADSEAAVFVANCGEIDGEPFVQSSIEIYTFDDSGHISRARAFVEGGEAWAAQLETARARA